MPQLPLNQRAEFCRCLQHGSEQPAAARRRAGRQRPPPEGRPASRDPPRRLAPRRSTAGRALGPSSSRSSSRDVCASAPARLTAFQETGELDTAYQPAGLPRFRVNAFRQRGDISFAFRAIPSDVPTFDSLRISAGRARTSPDENRGLILVTGATGVGKTTTLASMLGHINRTRRQHIVTIEDPIEILHSDEGCIVNQREVGLDTESFNEALRRVLRQDPDVILIGELRDSETAETALQAAESGHLVLVDDAHARRGGDRRPVRRVLPGRQAARRCGRSSPACSAASSASACSRASTAAASPRSR